MIVSNLSSAQNCICEIKPELNEIISCKKTIFKNGAKIYREFNCDSSWVVFENKKKKILFSLDKELIELTGRLGFANWTEYKKTFLVEYHTISGCCDPYEYILFNKTNGNKIADIGRAIYFSEKEVFPYFVTLDKNKSYFLSFLNLETSNIFKIYLPKGRIDKTLKITNTIFPETLFEKGEIKNGLFIITYRYKRTKKEKWLYGKVIVNLKKYVS